MLAQHPQIDAALEQELVALGDRPLTLDQLNQLTLTGQVLQETLRLYPPAWIIARAAAEDDRVCDVTIPGGSLVITSPYATQRLPEFFSQPERFDPQRFRADAGMNGGHSRYAYFPFGAGPRICIGNGFAWLETRLVLATLRRRFRLRVVAEAPIRPLPQLTLRCRGGVPVRAELVT